MIQRAISQLAVLFIIPPVLPGWKFSKRWDGIEITVTFFIMTHIIRVQYIGHAIAIALTGTMYGIMKTGF